MPGATVRIAAGIVILACLTVTAQAHSLKLFATVEDGIVHGYGFFVGGGRSAHSRLIIRDDRGVEVFTGMTGSDGTFTFRPTRASNLYLTIDAGDGHVAQARIAAERFPPNGTFGAIGAAKAAQSLDAAPAADQTPSRNDTMQRSTGPPTDQLIAAIDQKIDHAVARQIAPLLEAYAAAEARLRFNDIVSGVAAIIGLSGLFLWATSRRRRDDKPGTSRDAP